MRVFAPHNAEEIGEGDFDRPPTDAAAWLALVALIAVAIYAGLTIGSAIDPALTDARADWITATAAREGGDPWTDVQTLADQFGTEYRAAGSTELGDFERVHPRTPGALILMWPLTLFGAESSQMVLIVLATGSAVAVAMSFLWRKDGSSTLVVWPVSILLVGSAAYLSTLEFATQSMILLLLVAITWHLTRTGDSARGGVALGLAITLRLFPGLLLIPLWIFGRRKAVGSSVLVFSILNLAGLLIYDLNTQHAIEALRTASRGWAAFSGNGSLVMVFARVGIDVQIVGTFLVTLAIAIAIAVSFRSRSLDNALALSIVLALLASPLSWEHYDVLAFLVVYHLINWIVISNSRDRWMISALFAWLGLQMSATLLDAVFATETFSLSGTLALTGRLILLLAVVRLFVSGRQDTGPNWTEGDRMPAPEVAGA